MSIYICIHVCLCMSHIYTDICDIHIYLIYIDIHMDVYIYHTYIYRHPYVCPYIYDIYIQVDYIYQLGNSQTSEGL